MGTALILVDVQYDFMDGSLAVPDAHAIIDPIIEASRLPEVTHVVFTRDWHPADHFSFSETPEFVDKSWPSHCVQGTTGALLHPQLERLFWNAPIFSKGMNPEREDYSGFAGEALIEGEKMDLAEYLDRKSIGKVLVAGLATDYCVRATVMDACENGWPVGVIADAIRGVNPVTTAVACADMADYGAGIFTLDTYREVGN